MRLPAVIWTAFASAFVSAAVLLAADQPNILFIMTDDHAAHAISAYGSKINTTPHIDQLAKEGMPDQKPSRNLTIWALPAPG